MKLPDGFLVSGINCGIKKKNHDLGLIYCSNFAKAQGVFTTNVNPAYSVVLCKKNIKNPVKAVLVNSGNANCYSHKTGLKDTEEIISKLAAVLEVDKKNILIASTGIIGKKLPKEKIIKSFPELINKLGGKTDDFSQSILTTDTFKKTSWVEISTEKNKAVITGFAKGAGMICPNMGTMLGFVLTDADLSKVVFKNILRRSVEKSFNSISIDGCMSTNDTVLLIYSAKVLLENEKQVEAFSQGLDKICLDLAKMVVKDGEGATKFVEIEIIGAKDEAQAKKAGLSLANSNLFKCALYGANSNWGRVISALGQAGIKVEENISIKSTSLKKKNVKVTVDLKKGKACWKVYTSDLTPEYVKINAEYS
ncbi:MAG: bifunctional glutamate N-acetyltransferase/amino-acid acetyltransferase ArgJ [Candidatus Omnitrophota bacterium]